MDRLIPSAVSLERWNMIVTCDTAVPGLVELLEADKHHDTIHSSFRDILVRHGDDGGWCVAARPRSKLYNYLEKIREAAGYPATGSVFYLVVKRA